MPKKVQEKTWNKAKKAFIKSYDRKPKKPSDFRITMSIYKDMVNDNKKTAKSIEKSNKPKKKSVAEKLFGDRVNR